MLIGVGADWGDEPIMLGLLLLLVCVRAICIFCVQVFGICVLLQRQWWPRRRDVPFDRRREEVSQER